MNSTNKSKQNNSGVQILIAPFRGITLKHYRNALARHFGYFNEAYAPFISGIGEQKVSRGKLNDILPIESHLTPTVPQIIGNNAREIILFARAIEDEGFSHLNWNLGCPFVRIANKRRGCGLLPYPDEIESILQEVFSHINIALSIKMRLGYKDQKEFAAVIDVLNAFPLKHIILHPRTGLQGYKGEASPEAFLSAMRSTSHDLIYNGDIFNHSRFRSLLDMLTDIHGWMPGRGVLINPFLPAEIRGVFHNDTEKRKMLENFHHELMSYYLTPGHEKRSLGMLKAIWHYMSGVFSNAPEVFLRIKRSKNKQSYNDAVSFAMEQAFSGERELEDWFRQLTTRL